MKEKRTPEQQSEIDSFVFHFFFNHGLFDELAHLEKLVEETELYLNQQLEKSKIEGNEEDLDSRFGRLFQFQSIFPNMLYKALFLHQYSVLEDSLNQICHNLEESQLYNISLTDIKGMGINRARIYLEKVGKITQPFQTNSWNTIMKLNRVRNVLIHANGFIGKENKKDLNVCKSFENIEVTPEHEGFSIGLTKSFCELSIKEIGKFFYDTYDSMFKMKKSVH